MFGIHKRIQVSSHQMIFFALMTLYMSVFLCITLTNHALFRTFALDLGMFNHALYQINQFQWPMFSLSVDGTVVPYFADHFSPIIYLFAPLYYLFGDSTLLWIQVLSILIMAIYLRKLALHFHLPPLISSMAPLLPLSCWAVFAAVGFDFHTNVVGSMLVLPLIYYTLTQRIFALALFAFLILICKENMALWLVFILSGLLVAFRSQLNRKTKLFLTVASVVSLLYFVLVTSWWMPALHPTGTNIQLNKYIGSDGGIMGVIQYCLNHPINAISLLVLEPNGATSRDKLDFLLLFLASGGLLWLIHPILIWMSIPIAAQKFLSLNGGPWGIEAQYSIEIVPLIGFGIVLFLRNFTGKQAFVFLTLSVIGSLHFSYSYYFLKQPRVNFLQSEFAQSRFQLEELHQFLKKIPDEAAVSCVSVFAPKLANRDKIYHFPNINDAEYIVLLKGNLSTYPLNAKDYQVALKELKSDSTWHAWQYSSDAVIFKKK